MAPRHLPLNPIGAALCSLNNASHGAAGGVLLIPEATVVGECEGEEESDAGDLSFGEGRRNEIKIGRCNGI
jgi:hypothetical protein